MKETVFATDRLTKEEIAALGNSSGMILEEENGTVSIGYVDYDVSQFGGRDYECFYQLDAENAALLKSVLAILYSGDFFDRCAQAFTVKFSNRLFESFCADHKIVYQKHSY